MPYSIQVPGFVLQLINSIKGAQCTFRSYSVKQQHRYECLNLSFSLERYGNVCIDVLPRIEKLRVKFLVKVNVENDEEELKKHLEKRVADLFSELFSEKANQFIRDIESEKISFLFLFSYHGLILHINSKVI